MKYQDEFIQRLQAKTAYMAIGRSTLRSQGAAGMVCTARKYFAKFDLQKFSVNAEEDFCKVLNEATSELASSFPGGGNGNWGAARKAANIFLRDVVYNVRYSEVILS